VGRRRALVGLSGFVAAAMGADRAWAQTSRSCVLTPEAGEGPFYLDPKLVRGDITSEQPGAPLQLAMQVVRAEDCATLANARVDVWHADANGKFDMTGFRLRGHQLTDAEGQFRCMTVMPGAASGRAPHIGVNVKVQGKADFWTELFFPDEPRNARDTRFHSDLLLKLVPEGRSRRVHFDIVLAI